MSAPIGWVAGKNDSLVTIIEKLGLKTNLKLCLDAGDINSYSGSGIKWLDTSGNGYDFYFGDGSTSSTYPTFNGSAGGLSASEYFSFDGGDYFTYDSSYEAWMNTLHNAGISVSVLLVATAASGGNYWFSTGVNNITPGAALITYLSGDTHLFEWNVYDTPFGISYLQLSSNALYGNPPDKLAVLGFSNTENSGTTCIPLVKGITQAPVASVLGDSNSNTMGTFRIGARGDGTNFLINGAKLAGLAIWVGTQLTSTQLQSIANALQRRFK